MSARHVVHREHIEALKREALYAGDKEQVRLCNLALDFKNESPEAIAAWDECKRVILETMGRKGSKD